MNNDKQLTSYNKQLNQHEEKFLILLDTAGLPSQDILVNTSERLVVFANSGSVLDKMDLDAKANAKYVSKFFAAVGAGLFDAALNYIWDETILHLRKRIEAYDLEYFYEIAAPGEKRRSLNTIDDIVKLTDDELIKGALKIDLITEPGYRNIDLVRYMRNNASAAHPNHLEITGIKLISMAEDCIREVISTPIPETAIAVQLFLRNIKSGSISETDALYTSAHFPDLGPVSSQRLSKGIFGIFVDRDTTEQVRQNIRNIAPLLWPYIDDETRKSFGIKHALFSANNHLVEKKYAKEFLQVVDGLGYISDQLRAVEIISILDELNQVHNSMNNFYNEVLPARRLRSIVGNPADIPQGAEKKYVQTLINVFITNGYGVSNDANPIYLDLINELSPKQAVYAIAQAFDESISSKLRIPTCILKFKELVAKIESKISTHAASQLLVEINKSKNLSELKKNKRFVNLANEAMKEQKLS